MLITGKPYELHIRQNLCTEGYRIHSEYVPARGIRRPNLDFIRTVGPD